MIAIYILLTCTRFGVHFYISCDQINGHRIKTKTKKKGSNYAENYIAHFRKVSRDIPNYLKNRYEIFVSLYKNETDCRFTHFTVPAFYLPCSKTLYSRYACSEE